MSAFGFELLRPWWLLALPLLALTALLLRRRSRALGGWARAMDPALIDAMRRLGRVSEAAPRRRWLPLLAAAIVALALTGPAKLRRDTQAYRNLDAVVIVLDLSPSMTASAAFRPAITAGRLVALAAGTRQTALIVYAGDAYLAAPLTTDSRALGETMALLDAQTMPDTGSRPARALAIAHEVLTAAEIAVADVVLIGDGAGLGPASIAEARRLAAIGASLSVIATEPGPEVEALAMAGGGRVVPASAPEPLLNDLQGRVAARLAEAGYAVILWRDHGRYLLCLALLPAILLFRRRR